MLIRRQDKKVIFNIDTCRVLYIGETIGNRFTICTEKGEHLGSYKDECPVLNEVAEKLARYEKLEEQIAELAEQRIQNGTITSYAIVPEVTKGIADIAFEQFERSKKNEQST